MEEQIRVAADRYEADIRSAGERYENEMNRILMSCQDGRDADGDSAELDAEREPAAWPGS